MSRGLLQDLPITPEPAAPAGRPPLLLGDEAVAMAAVHAGISSAYAYPGTPSTEIFEAVLSHADDNAVTAHWCTNEKTAYEQALGASMVGTRTLVSMKHVGLNVAMDPFVNSALVRIHGGLVLVVADDPGMHSSQNEQDSRVLADFARVPCLEPATQQEAYDMTRAAFALSEHFHVPVMVRLVTRICHGRAEVITAPPEEQAEARKFGDSRDWTLLPANARRLWQTLLDTQPALRRWVEGSRWVRSRLPQERAPLGVVTTGIARNYLEELLPELGQPVPHVHVGAYPAPEGALRALAERVDRILVLEEGFPFVETRLRGVFGGPVPIHGKETGHLPLAGELTPDSVRSALGLAPRPQLALPMALPARPPQLCPGCPHRDAFAGIRKALDGFEGGVAAGDIGCYTLGALPPYGALESCVCMGASVGMAKGASDAGAGPTLAIVGDSTFLHSGLPGLADAVAHDTAMTLVILDNSTVAMTGQQPTTLSDARLEPILLGMGVNPDHLHVVTVHPKRTEELAALLRREMRHPGLSVIVGARPCIEAARKEKQARRSEGGGEA